MFKFKKLFSVILVIMMVINMSATTFASEAEHKEQENQSNSIVEYSYIGTSIQEIAYIQIEDTNLISNRLINIDGSFTMTISDGKDTNTVEGNVNYNEFKMITDSYISQSSTIIPFGSDLTGSQYKHVYIGTTGNSHTF